jgi:hypothetical protein
VKINRLRDKCVERYTREYENSENEVHVKYLCYCKHKMDNTDRKNILRKDAVILGNIVDEGVKRILGMQVDTISKKVGKYTVYGTPDIIVDGKVIDIKFSAYPRKQAGTHDIMQMKLYLWLYDVDVGYLWYLIPKEFQEFEVSGAYSDEEVIRLIENHTSPRWDWECNSKYCELYPCKNVIK